MNLADLPQLLLLAAGVVLLVKQTRRERGRPAPQVAPWLTDWWNFFAWVFLIAVALSFSGMLAQPTHPDGPNHQPSELQVLISGNIQQAMVLLVQIGIYFARCDITPPPLNRAKLSPGQIFIQGVTAFLAAYPVIFIASAAWTIALNILHQIRPDLQTPLQSTVKLISEQPHSGVVLLTILFAVTLAPVNEELLFRAGLYRFLKGKLPTVAALAVASILFSLAHASLLQFGPLLAIGWMLARAYDRSGHIGVPMVFHALFNLNTIVMVMLFPG